MKWLGKSLVASSLLAGILAVSGSPMHVQAQELSKTENLSSHAFAQGIIAPQAIVINRPMRVGQEDQYVGISNVSYSGGRHYRQNHFGPRIRKGRKPRQSDIFVSQFIGTACHQQYYGHPIAKHLNPREETASRGYFISPDIHRVYGKIKTPIT
nr:hypothetical protein [Bacillus licheniformis]